MTTKPTDRFAFEDFTGTVSCEGTSPEVELEVVFDDHLRAAWKDLPIREIELREVDPASLATMGMNSRRCLDARSSRSRLDA